MDIVAFGAHPDDVELGCGATLAKHAKQGHQIAIVDLTRGDYGTRGTPEERLQEAECAARVLGIARRINLELEDAFFEMQRESLLAVIRIIRELRPRIVLLPAPQDRHPDHPRAAQLVLRALFLAGLRKIETSPLAPHRPDRVYHYIQHDYLMPDFVVDVSDTWETKLKALRCYRSQFDPSYPDPQTLLSSQRFFHFLEARARLWGFYAGCDLAEGFLVARPQMLKFDALPF